jgi:hypothetical protein
VGSAVLDWVTGGSALAALGKVSLAVCALVLGLVSRRYLGILGADPKEPFEWDVYTAMRDSLTKGNLAARLYADQLTRFLDWTDRFFGDAGEADRTLFPHIFGLRTPVPLWTVPAFYRCLLLALIYPIVAIVFVWTVSGHVGPAEAALHLRMYLSAWWRWFSAAAIGISAVALWGVARSNGWRRMAYALACSGAFVIGMAFAVSSYGGSDTLLLRECVQT